jgi:hypothetical protein
MANEEPAPEGTLTRNALRDAAYRSCPYLSRAEVRRIFDETLGEISDALLFHCRGLHRRDGGEIRSGARSRRHRR